MNPFEPDDLEFNWAMALAILALISTYFWLRWAGVDFPVLFD